MEQDGRSGVFAPGNLVVYDTSRPFHTITDPGDVLGSGLNLTVPRALVPLPENKVAGLLVTPLPGRNGIGGLLSRYLLQLVKDSGQYRPSDTARLRSVALDLITAMFAHMLEADDAVPPETRQQCPCRKPHPRR